LHVTCKGAFGVIACRDAGEAAMKKPEKRLIVSRGKDGSIKVDARSLYTSEKVLKQLDATVRFAEKAGLLQTRKKSVAA
jgi:hypothetical protein